MQDAREVYKESISVVRRGCEKKLTEIREQYLMALEKLAVSVRESGNLDSLLQIQEEISQVKEGGALLPLPRRTSEDLRRLRDLYSKAVDQDEEEFDQRVGALAEVYQSFLQELMKSLVKQNRIAEAKEVRNELSRIKISPIPKEEPPPVEPEPWETDSYRPPRASGSERFSPFAPSSSGSSESAPWQ